MTLLLLSVITDILADESPNMMTAFPKNPAAFCFKVDDISFSNPSVLLSVLYSKLKALHFFFPLKVLVLFEVEV